jgi:N-acetylglucosamine-6-phosphate deacetylase
MHSGWIVSHAHGVGYRWLIDYVLSRVAKMDDCVRNFARFADISLADALVCASQNVAKMLGNPVNKRKGSLLPGFDADLVVFDTTSGEVEETWVAGQRLYVKTEQ